MPEGSESRTERDLTKRERIVYPGILMWRHIGKGVAGLFGVLLTISTDMGRASVATADIRVYRDSKGVLYITNKLARPVKNAGTATPRYRWGTDSAHTARTKGLTNRQDRLASNSPAFGGRRARPSRTVALASPVRPHWLSSAGSPPIPRLL